jgi:methionyl-tRNA formyltransferase
VSSRIAVAATAPLGADVLEQLAARHVLSVVLTRPDAHAGRGRKLAPPPAKETAERLGIPVLQPERLERGLELDAPVVVVVAYGKLVPDALLEERLWLNVHPSLLPRWRGAAPIERAIMAGDVETGVTIHRTIKELDAGPVAAQRAFLVEEDDDAGDVSAKAAAVAVELLDEVLGNPQIDFRPQSEEGVTYAEKIGPDDRILDLRRPARELVDVVRALSPHIGARAELHGRSLTVWRARVGEDGTFEPLEVQPEGGRRMEYDAWLRGLR